MLKLPTMKPRERLPMPCDTAALRRHLRDAHGYACVSRAHSFASLVELHERAHHTHNAPNHDH